jgi:hypothetical protein
MSEVQIEDNSINIDVELIGTSLGVDASLIQALIREGKITSLCKRGVDADGGIYRPTFFHANRRLRLIVGESGNIIRRSMIDFGNRPIRLRHAIPACRIVSSDCD